MDKIKLNNGIDLAYEIVGDKKNPKMVLIHDIFVNSNVWKNQISSSLKDKFNILRYDLRGHGKSSKPYSKYTIRNHIDDLKNLLRELNWSDDLYLIGHSLGGMIAMCYGLENSSNIKRLVISNSFCSFSSESISHLMEHLKSYSLEEFCQLIISKSIFPFNKDNYTLLRKSVVNYMAKNDCFNAVAAYSGFHICDELKKLKIPTLIIAGEKDLISPVWAHEMIHKWIKNSNLVIISEVGHHIYLNHPDEFNNLVLKYWKEEMNDI